VSESTRVDLKNVFQHPCWGIAAGRRASPPYLTLPFLPPLLYLFFSKALTAQARGHAENQPVSGIENWPRSSFFLFSFIHAPINAFIQDILVRAQRGACISKEGGFFFLYFSCAVCRFQIKGSILARLASRAARACSRGPRQTAGTCSAASRLGPRTQRWRPRCRTCRRRGW